MAVVGGGLRDRNKVPLKDITDLAGFSQVLKKLTPGQEVETTVVRDNTKITVKVAVKERSLPEP